MLNLLPLIPASMALTIQKLEGNIKQVVLQGLRQDFLTWPQLGNFKEDSQADLLDDLGCKGDSAFTVTEPHLLKRDLQVLVFCRKQFFNTRPYFFIFALLSNSKFYGLSSL